MLVGLVATRALNDGWSLASRGDDSLADRDALCARWPTG